MKKIVFNKIEIKNFLSVGENPIVLNFQKGINLITGNNRDKDSRNGVGKSTIVESLFWCLFGNTMRDIKKDKIIHNQSKKGCEVKLDLIVDNGREQTSYTITRTLEPNKINIISHSSQGDIDCTLSTMPKTDEFIKELIGATEEVFQNAVIMTANNTTPFMAQKKVDKRKFVEGILNLGIFGEMLLATRGDYNEVKREVELKGKDFINKQKNLEIFENQKEKTFELKEQKINDLNTKIAYSIENLNNLKSQNIPTNEDVSDQILEIEGKIEKLQKALNVANKEFSDIGKKIVEENSYLRQKKTEKQKFLDKGNICPTCNREYCQEDLVNIETQIKELDSLISKHSSDISKLERDRNEKESLIEKITEGTSKFNKKLKELNSESSKASVHQEKINNTTEKIKEYEEDLKKVKAESFDDKNIESTKEEIKILEEEISDKNKSLQILDTVKYVVSEEGVKTYIIKKMLSLLNSRLNYYLQVLEAPCKCEFDEVFEEIIHNEAGKECSYFNFSGGERKRIDLAVLFTFQDLLRMQTGSTFSLSMYDELFDSAIDEKGADKILEILKTRVDDYNECVYIVSHNKMALKTNIDNIIHLEKKNGKTQILSS